MLLIWSALMIDASASPFRITHCLKRVGKRGEGRWKSISFEQLVEEVVEGGDLFGEGHDPSRKGISALTESDTGSAVRQGIPLRIEKLA